MYYKHVWRVADEHFVSEQLQEMRDSARKVILLYSLATNGVCVEKSLLCSQMPFIMY